VCHPASVARPACSADRMMQLCLGLAGVIWAQLPVTGFTLAWQHSVEQIRWEEDDRVEPAGLRPHEARVRGSGAGMEIPEDAVLRDGSWHYRPQLAPLAQLRLARSTAERAADYQLCTAGQCRALAHWLGPPSAGQPVVELWSCAPAVGGGRRAGYNGAFCRNGVCSVEKLKGAIVVGSLKLFAWLPFGAAQRVGAFVGWLMWKLPNRSREVVRTNLRHCCPELSEQQRERLVGETLVNIGRSFAESACAWMWDPARTVALIREVEGEHLLDEALASGKGVVGITSHLGNWEVLNHWYCRKCSPIIFYRPPK